MQVVQTTKEVVIICVKHLLVAKAVEIIDTVEVELCAFLLEAVSRMLTSWN